MGMVNNKCEPTKQLNLFKLYNIFQFTRSPIMTYRNNPQFKITPIFL